MRLTVLLEALAFAADRHRDQRRRDGETPYLNHVIAVTNVLATVGGVEDEATLVAALLHDTIEDTDTTGAEIEERFGREVRELVEELTDDKELPRHERKQLQVVRAPSASRKAKLIKLADKISNVGDLTRTPPPTWSIERRRQYLDWTETVIAGCRGVHPDLERLYDEALQAGRTALDGADEPGS